jgi:hypothetical protein
MFKALAIKELRESAGVIAIGVVAALYVLALLTGMRFLPFTFNSWITGTGIPFVSDGFSSAYVLVIGGLAVALGLKQSAWEAGQGTYSFLLHRPASRRAIFGTKLVIGGGLVWLVGGLLVLLYAWWSASPGNSATPFYWSMTAPAWQLWACVSLVYLGAFLSGIRPARWFGTRLFPLVAAAVLAVSVWLISWWWFWFGTLAIFAGLIVASILYYARRRDY